MIETTPSNFSVIMMAGPPSRGTIKPAMNGAGRNIMESANRADTGNG